MIHPFGNCKQLDAVVELRGVLHVTALQLADACCGNGAAIDRSTKGEARKDGDFVGSIKTVHIGCGIGFGVAKVLGVFQHLLVVGPFLGHAGQDVIGGAVDDSGDPLNAVTAQ